MQSGKNRILVVDDIEANRIILGKALRAAGYEVSTVGTAQEAVEQIDSLESHDLVLLDLGLPDFDGLEVLQMIRKNRRHAKVKVCIASARNDSATISRAKALGSDGFVSKPMKPSEVVEKVAKLLRPVRVRHDFHSVETLLKCQLLKSPVEPDMRVIKLSESGMILKSSAGFALDAQLHIRCDTLAKASGDNQPLTCVVLKSTRAGYGRYEIDVQFEGPSENAVQKFRALAIKGEMISDFH